MKCPEFRVVKHINVAVKKCPVSNYTAVSGVQNYMIHCTVCVCVRLPLMACRSEISPRRATGHHVRGSETERVAADSRQLAASGLSHL